MNGPLHLDLLRQLLPEAVLVVSALAVLLLDLRVFGRRALSERMANSGTCAAVGLLASWGVLGMGAVPVETLAGAFRPLPGTQFLKGVLLLLSLATVVFAMPGRFTRHAGEFFALLLIATAGMMLLIGTDNLLMLFVALELVSLTLYVLTALHEERPGATEAALKYFLFGGIAAALTLFGMSLLYGLTGSVQLSVIGSRLAALPREPLLWIALVMTLSGLAFKIAVAPFHLWAPDVYQGAPTPAAALVASGSKVAGFVLLLRVLHVGFGANTAGSAGRIPWSPGWIPWIAVLSTLSMVAGNLTALRQTDLRRLLAYSAIAQGGYGLLGLMDPRPESGAAVLYFAVTYAITALGAFGVVAAMEAAGEEPTLPGLAGLGRRSPVLAACLSVFVLSMAGIPPLAGFFGKFFVFVRAISSEPQSGRLWILSVAVGTSAVALYYYLQIVRHALLLPAATPAPALRVAPLTLFALLLLAGATLVLGFLPGLLLNPLQ
ncbi:MAG: NADH-quinone oxidoreductase subunit N [Verrucomicrobiales bacterium]|nr:NADH-quinone oxidoreductase subunit N [Verrucomicrobiales bacterium]